MQRLHAHVVGSCVLVLEELLAVVGDEHDQAGDGAILRDDRAPASLRDTFREAYREGVEYVDAQLAEFLVWMKDTGRRSRSTYRCSSSCRGIGSPAAASRPSCACSTWHRQSPPWRM